MQSSLAKRLIVPAIMVAAAAILSSCNLPGATPTPPPISGDLYVSPSGSDSNSCQSAGDACATIGAAIGKASSGDTVAVLAGTYTEQVSANKDLDVIGEGPGSTVVSGGGSGPVFNNNGASLLLSELTIREGSATDGGCIYNDGSLALVNVTVERCTADNGAAIYNAGSLNMGAATVRDNQANIYGGGLYNASGASATIDDSTFEGNQAPTTGRDVAQGGSAIFTLSSLNIDSSTIQNNSGKESILADDAPLTIQDTDILNNQKGVASYNQQQEHSINVSIDNSSIEDNSTGGIAMISGTLQLSSTSVHRNGINGMSLTGTNGTLSDLSLRENGGGSSGHGGGLLFTGGQLTIENSLIRDNTSPDNGGGIHYTAGNASSKLTLNDVQFTENEATDGGGLYAADGNLELNSVEMNANTATNQGGAIYASNDPRSTFSQLLLIQDSSIHANEAIAGSGGGIFTIFPDLTIRQSALYNNSAASNGGAIYSGFNMEAPNPPLLNLVNVTISGNEADFGGGISLFSVFSLNHVTITNNHARSAAGGIGFSRTPPGAPSVTTVFDNNIVAANNANDPGTENCNFGTFPAPAQNMEDLDTCGFTVPNTNPILGPLQNNGGPTYTHALGSSSPAIDAATSTNCVPADQRGISRPQGAACDVGAFELEDPPATPTPAATATPELACQAELTFADASYGSIAYREGQGETLVILEVPAEMEQEAYPATINGQSFECTTSPDFPEQLFCVGPRVTEGVQAEMELFAEGCTEPVFEAEFSVPFPLYPTPTPTASPSPEVTEIPE